MILDRRFILWLASIAVISSASTVNAAQSGYPTRPIRIIVGFSAGGGTDVYARIVGQKLSDLVGQSVIIENKPGASGRLAAEYAVKQPADGYTLLVSPNGPMSIGAAIYQKLPYEPTRSFVPLAMIARTPLTLVVPTNFPVKTVRDLVDWAKSHPDSSNYGASGPGLVIASELLKLKSGMPGILIPYKSGAEAVTAVAGDQILFAIADGAAVVPMVQSGTVRALAVLGSERFAGLPDVPSMAEAGFPDVDIGLWVGIFAVSGGPADVVTTLDAALRTAINDPQVQSKLRAVGVVPGGASLDGFAKLIEDETAKMRELVRAANLSFPE